MEYQRQPHTKTDLEIWLDHQSIDILKNIMRNFRDVDKWATSLGSKYPKAGLVQHVGEHVIKAYQNCNEIGQIVPATHLLFLIQYCQRRHISFKAGAPTASAYYEKLASTRTITQMWDDLLQGDDVPEKFFDSDFKSIC